MLAKHAYMHALSGRCLGVVPEGPAAVDDKLNVVARRAVVADQEATRAMATQGPRVWAHPSHALLRICIDVGLFEADPKDAVRPIRI